MIVLKQSWLGIKRQRRCFERCKNFIPQIYDMYWETFVVEQPKIIQGEVCFEKIRKFKWKVKEIMAKYFLSGIQELLFLIAQDSRTDLNEPLSRSWYDICK